ncbi:MAG: hypothetical protein K2X90_00295 [Candidatus Babeliaceae bacterium]|nr:hypothetical protein [Candidatus Babeliaceae bacterium]
MNKNNFLKLIAIMLAGAQTNLFAPKGGGGVSRGCHMECEYRGGSIGNCSDLTCSYGDSGQRESNSHGGNYGNSSGNGSSGSSYDGTVAAPAISSAAAIETAGRELLDQCYVVYSNRQAVKTCSKQEVLTAVKSVSTLYAGVAAGELTDNEAHKMVMGLISLGLPLDCAAARQAPVELCQKSDHFSTMHQIMKDYEEQKMAAAQHQSQRIVSKGVASDGMRRVFPDINLEALLSECYNDVSAGKKTEADAKKSLTELRSKGLSLEAVREVVIATAQKVKSEIEHEVAEYKELLLRPKRFNQAQLAAAMNCNGGMYNLPPAEIADLTHQFGGERWLIRAFELTTRRCAAPQKMRHLCYSYAVGGGVIAGHPAVAAFDAMSDAQVAARFDEADRQLARLKAQGLA